MLDIILDRDGDISVQWWRCTVCYACGIRTKNGSAIKTIFACKACLSEPGLHPETLRSIIQNYDEP